MDNLIPLYQKLLHLQNASFTRIENEEAMVAVVYRVTPSTGPQFILKICTRANDFLREVYFLNFFKGKLPVPRIMDVVQPEGGIKGAILMECLPGSLLKKTDFTDTLAYEIGSLLARIHLNRTAGYGDLIQPQDLLPGPRIYFTQKFEEGLSECSSNLPKALLEQCRGYFDTYVGLLVNVDGPCMIHRDFRAGNVIVHNGKLQGIIDWASGRASFAQDDFCPLEHGEWPATPTNKSSFLKGYASNRQVPDYSDMMPLLRLSRAVATIGCVVKSGTWDSIHAKSYQFNRTFLETFFL
jgi:hypothetical protein